MGGFGGCGWFGRVVLVVVVLIFWYVVCGVGCCGVCAGARDRG